MNKVLLLFALLGFCCIACNSDTVLVPKPRAYPKVIYPDRAYELTLAPGCNFKFERPRYASIQKDSLFFDEQTASDCWFDVVIPQFDARIHCSYYSISSNNPLSKLRDDAFKLANKHNMKASYIDEIEIRKPNQVNGFVFNIEGPAASPFQFFLTDSTKHFLRGSLYFDTQANPDSLAPIVDFVKYDIMHIINTFEWTD